MNRYIRSSCCKNKIDIHSVGDGTCLYFCVECGKPCDIYSGDIVEASQPSRNEEIRKIIDRYGKGIDGSQGNILLEKLTILIDTAVSDCEARWKSLSVTAVAAENQSTFEYISQCEKEIQALKGENERLKSSRVVSVDDEGQVHLIECEKCRTFQSKEAEIERLREGIKLISKIDTDPDVNWEEARKIAFKLEKYELYQTTLGKAKEALKKIANYDPKKIDAWEIAQFQLWAREALTEIEGVVNETN